MEEETETIVVAIITTTTTTNIIRIQLISIRIHRIEETAKMTRSNEPTVPIEGKGWRIMTCTIVIIEAEMTTQLP